VRIGARVDPVALFETHHTDAGTREPPGDRGAGGAGSDHEHVGAIVGGHGVRPTGRPRPASRASATAVSLSIPDVVPVTTQVLPLMLGPTVLYSDRNTE